MDYVKCPSPFHLISVIMEAVKTVHNKGKQVMDDDQQHHSCGELSKLPTDLTFDILSRLPLHLLSPCRWVCKTWFHFIKHPSLAKMHYTRSIRNNTSPCFLLYDEWNDFFMIDHQVFDHFKTTAPLHCVKFCSTLFAKFSIVGSVNGLVCFSPNELNFSLLTFYICNPITGEIMNLPMSDKTEVYPDLSGFGFDSETNEYKVICIFQKNYQSEAHVFTLGSGAWRVLSNIPYISDTTESNVLVNGSLHWLTHDGNSLTVVSWGVACEDFRMIQLPVSISSHEENVSRDKYLGMLEGCLAFIIADSVSPTHKKEIWVMKDYGVQTSWVKEYTVSDTRMFSPWDGGYALTKLRNDEFLFQYNRCALGYYDSRSEVFRLIIIENKLWSGTYVQALMHSGSLFSPNNVGQLAKSSNIKRKKKVHEKSADAMVMKL